MKYPKDWTEIEDFAGIPTCVCVVRSVCVCDRDKV